ncbi:MAG: sensor histidine kinase, partial [Acaryochloridaceae cyanobacterium RL_2_7]|nr:sensor histidine kinase [Acaryochloridaceae cyanobacterium RL_2_7]
MKQWLQEFPPIASDYRWPMQFSRRLLDLSAQLNEPSVVVDLPTEDYWEPAVGKDIDSKLDASVLHSRLTDKRSEKQTAHDVELLKAIAHEIRTPLATIKTLTQLLIRKKGLPEDVVRRLESIQQECTQQIDRFSLIFRAIELTTTPSASLSYSLTALSLQQLFAQKMARWETILERRSLDFDVAIP